MAAPSFKLSLIMMTALLTAVTVIDAGAADRLALQTRLTKLEQLLQQSGDYQRYLLLDTAAQTAFDLGDYEKANSYAGQLLQLANRYSHDWNYGSALHRAHIIAGRVALAKNDLDIAKRKLLAAGSVEASQSLNQYGPDFELANALLQRGEISTVANYLQLVKKLWPNGRAQLNDWLKRLGRGDTPVLGNAGR